MESLYLLVNENSYFQEKKIKELKEKNPTYEVIRYDLKEIPLSKVIEDLDTVGFFSSHKMVIVDNPFFLTSEGSKEEKIDLTFFEKYIANPNPDNTLILCCSKLDERKKIVKQLKKVATCLTLEVSPETIIKDNLEDYQMDFQTKNLLIEKCGSNYERLEQELTKLKLYTYDTKKITKEDVDLVVVKEEDENIFDLIDAIVTKKKDVAYTIYQTLLEHSEEPIKILIQVANQFRLIYQAKVLNQEHQQEQEIASFLKVHPYRIKLALQKGHNYSQEELLKILLQLSYIDESLKNGTTFQNTGFEFFLLNL